MYRTRTASSIAKRLLTTTTTTTTLLRPNKINFSPIRYYCTNTSSSSSPFSDRDNISHSSGAPNPNPNPNTNTNTNTTNFNTVPPHTTSSSYSSTGSHDHQHPHRRVAGYEHEQARVLQASLRHVHNLGWTEAAMMAGAREVGVSPSIVGSFPRKEAALVEYFMDECLERLVDVVESDVELKNHIPSERISKLVKTRLEMQVPYISKWAQALSIQALPANIATSFKQRAALVDEIWHAAGDNTSDLDWYVKRTVLGGLYSTTEVYMLTDNSPEFRDTWAYLDARVRDAFDLKKTLQEAQYLAEAVSAGLGGTLQGMMKGVFRR